MCSKVKKNSGTNINQPQLCCKQVYNLNQSNASMWKTTKIGGRQKMMSFGLHYHSEWNCAVILLVNEAETD